MRSSIDYLNQSGHSAIPFSVQNRQNWPSKYSDFFLSPLGKNNAAHYEEIRLSPLTVLKGIERTIYSFEAKRKLSQLLDQEPDTDIGLIANIYNYMSPSIIHTFKQKKIPVVLWVGDYFLLCPRYTFLRDGKPCTACLRHRQYKAVLHRCVKNSVALSALRSFSMYLHKFIHLWHSIDAIIAPCIFMQKLLIENGFDENKIHHIPQIPPPIPQDIHLQQPAPHPREYILYFGRISPEKGLKTLIKAYQQTRATKDLIIIGRSYDGHREELEQLVDNDHRQSIYFHDFMETEALSVWIHHALFSVVPSEWYDNAPLSILESYMGKTAVLGADIGGIPELIKNEQTGILFTPTNVEELRDQLENMMLNVDKVRSMGRNGYKLVTEEFSLDQFMKRFLDLLHTTAASKK